MGMPMELNTMIVTKGLEIREKENIFSLTKEGYRLYPIQIPIDVRKTKESDSNGTGVIQSITWENGTTVLIYQLISLNTTN